MLKLFNRVMIVIMDSVGVGELPDADKYGDSGVNTLAHVAEATGGLSLPHFEQLGLGNIIEIKGVPPVTHPHAAYGKMAEISAGKDTTTGHWELMGLYLDKPFPTYLHGFPLKIIESFEKEIGRRVLCNRPTSGTEVIKALGKEHIETGCPIVYTSVDSVFQIAAHEEVIPVEELYRMCQVARELLTGEHAVGRVIARPFEGTPGDFIRTPHRKDFSLKPPSKTALDYAVENGFHVYAVGKIAEIFAGCGITKSVHTDNNLDTLEKTLSYMRSVDRGIIFANLVDFDMLWGHRNDAIGYAQGLIDVDRWLPALIGLLRPEDALFFTADHGCDPTTPGTDHTREYVPLLVCGDSIKPADLGIRQTFSDLGKTVAELLGFDAPVKGTSFAGEILKWPASNGG